MIHCSMHICIHDIYAKDRKISSFQPNFAISAFVTSEFYFQRYDCHVTHIKGKTLMNRLYLLYCESIIFRVAVIFILQYLFLWDKVNYQLMSTNINSKY